MRHIITALFTFTLGLALSSCGLNLKDDKKIELEQISINEDYSMGVPTFMTKATSLNDDASLQFQNIFKETYVIVIDEDKAEFIEAYTDADAYDSTRSVISNYTDTQVQLTTSNMDVVSKTDITTLKINGLDAATTEIDATVEGVKLPISYFLTFIEGKEKLYMVMAWTLQDKKDTYRATFDQMARSFKTLKDSPKTSEESPAPVAAE